MFCPVIELNLMIKTCDFWSRITLENHGFSYSLLIDVHVHIWLVCISINDVEMKK